MQGRVCGGMDRWVGGWMNSVTFLVLKLYVPSAISNWVFGRLSAQQKTLDWQVEAWAKFSSYHSVTLGKLLALSDQNEGAGVIGS